MCRGDLEIGMLLGSGWILKGAGFSGGGERVLII